MKKPAGPSVLRFTRSTLATFALGATAAGILTFSAAPARAAVAPRFSTADLDALLASIPTGSTDATQGDLLYKRAFLNSLKATITGSTTAQVPLWNNGVVPYTFASTVTEEQKTLFLAAAAEWSAIADITFVARASQADYIEVRAGDINQSHIGRQGGKQLVTLLDWSHKFAIVHQLGHTLGLTHEDVRSDRDAFLDIYPDRVQASKLTAIAKLGASDNLTDFDHISLFHRGPFAYAKGDLPTIQPFDPIPSQGQILFLSPGDIAGIQELYGIKPVGSVTSLTSPTLSLGQGIDAIWPQQDGKIIVAGQFVAAGTGKHNLLRLNSDGSLDSTFSPNINSVPLGTKTGVHNVVTLPDNRIAISGGFTTVNGTSKPNAAILTSAGALDTSFTAAAGATGELPAFKAVQEDGKLLVAYSTGSGNATLRRLNTVDTDTTTASNSGFKDTTFPDVVFTRTGENTNATIEAVLVEPDGQMLVAGSFHTAAGVPCNGFIRLTAAGVPAEYFTPPELFGARTLALQSSSRIFVGAAEGSTTSANPGISLVHHSGNVVDFFSATVAGIDAAVTGIHPQADGKVIITGSFDTVNGVAHPDIARLLSDGSLDTTFNPALTFAPRSSALAMDGSLLIGGSGVSRVRVSNDPATSAIYAERPAGAEQGTLWWKPDGSFPVAKSVTFSLSIDGGANWVELGNAFAANNTNDWAISNVNLPSSGILRVNASQLGAFSQPGGTSGAMPSLQNTFLIEGAPALFVNDGAGRISNADAVTVPGVTPGGTSTFTITLGNSGRETLENIATSIDGTDAADFTVTAAPSTSVNPSATSTLTITFKPTTSGKKQAFLRIASNDPVNPTFTLALSGQGLPVPEIAVQQPAKTELEDGASKKAFGTTSVGRVGGTKTFVILNTGDAPLKDIAVSVTGRNKKDFILITPRVKTIAPGEKASFRVMFKPAGKGPRIATLKITSNDADESPFEIDLNGKGTRGRHKPKPDKDKNKDEVGVD